MGIVGKSREEMSQPIRDIGSMTYFKIKIKQFIGRGKPAVEKQIATFKISVILCQFFDGNPPVAQFSLGSINKGDL